MPFDFDMKRRQQRGYHLGHKNITGLNHWKTRDPKFSTNHVNHVFTFRGAFLCGSLVWNTLGVPWNAIDKAFSKGATQNTSLCQGRTSDERAEVLKGEEHGKWKELYILLFFLDFSVFCKKAMVLGLPTVFQSFILGRIDYVGQQSLMKHPLFEKFLNSFGTHLHDILYIIRQHGV